MRFSAEDCWARLRTADHGVLCTTNSSGAIDAVPVCLAIVGRRIATPIDAVKPKSTSELHRRKNLQRTPEATLLCERWDPDEWSRLWWVRARLVYREADNSMLDACEAALRAKYEQYRTATFAAVLVFDVASVVGWSGAEGP
ncbi:MAG TPA: hypothetical protein VH012_06170 [Acidimicrobiales bacterium]|jgi:hypothetical protein|nr:hypothetical protein [Acidimicrobiales bacterium]